jgi:hypothetical protein
MRLFLLLGVVAFAIACSDPKVAEPPPEPSATLIGAEGGRVFSADGFALLDVPPNALAEPALISIKKTEDQSGALADTRYELSPDGLIFAQPARFSVRHTGTATAVTIVKAHDDGTFSGQPTFYDVETKTATASLGGFSSYGMLPSWHLPPPIDNFTATHENHATFLSWETSRQGPDYHLTIERAGPFLQPPRESDWMVLAELPPHSRSFGDSGPFTPDAIYWYRIRIRAAGHEGIASATFIGTFNDSPPRTLALEAQVTGTRNVNLTWDLFAVNLVEEFRIWVFVDGVRNSRPVRYSNLRSADTFRELPLDHYYSFALEALRGGVVQATQTVHVALGGFALVEVTPRILEVSAGSTQQAQVAVVRADGFNDSITYSLTPAPGISAVFQPHASDPRFVEMAVSVAEGTASGRHDLLIRGTAGTATSEKAITIEVPPNAGFDFTVTPNPLRMERNSTQSYQLAVRRFGDFTDPIQFEYVDPPAFLRNSSPPNIGGGYLIASSITNGTYELVIRGTGGAFVREVTLTIEIYGVPETRFLALQNRYDEYLHLSWAPVPGAEEYILMVDGVVHTRFPPNMTEFLFLMDTAMHGYIFKTVVGGEESDGHMIYSIWRDPATTANFWEIIAQCDPASPVCDPPIEFSYAGDDSMIFTVVGDSRNCAQFALELLINGQSAATTEAIFPGRDAPPIDITPNPGVNRYGLRAHGVPNWGCADATGTIDRWAGTVILSDR